MMWESSSCTILMAERLCQVLSCLSLLCALPVSACVPLGTLQPVTASRVAVHAGHRAVGCASSLTHVDERQRACEVRHMLSECLLCHTAYTLSPLTGVVLADMKGKEYVMKLMHHPDAEVQKQALLCVQKLMLAKDKLQFLGIEVAAGDF